MNEYRCWWEVDGKEWGYIIDAESEEKAASRYIEDFEVGDITDVLIVQLWRSASNQPLSDSVRFIVKGKKIEKG